MTLPTTINLPIRKNLEEKKDINTYLVDLVYELKDMYEKIASNVNGAFRSSYYNGTEQWFPVLDGANVSGAFTYTRQIGWIYRQGLMIDAWGDIEWSASGTASGPIQVNLPYKVNQTDGLPFVGPVYTSLNAYPAARTYVTINATPNTYIGQFYTSGTGIGGEMLQVTPTGRLIFHVRYIGVPDEQ